MFGRLLPSYAIIVAFIDTLDEWNSIPGMGIDSEGVPSARKAIIGCDRHVGQVVAKAMLPADSSIWLPAVLQRAAACMSVLVEMRKRMDTQDITWPMTAGEAGQVMHSAMSLMAKPAFSILREAENAQQLGSEFHYSVLIWAADMGCR